MRDLRLSRLFRRLGWKPSVQEEVDQELRHHLELLVSDAMARGATRDEAEREALARFGATEAVRRICENLGHARDRAERRSALLADLRDDWRWTWRWLRRSPSYTMAWILTLAVAVAANALVFTLVYGILFRPLPYPDSGRLVAINERILTGELWELSLPNLEALQAQQRAFEQIAGWNRTEATLQSEESPRIALAEVTPEFFPVLATPPLLGRTLQRADQVPAAGRAVVLSESAWRTHFGADRSILGRVITIDTEPFTVVGVMPAPFRFPHPDVAAWIPRGPPEEWMRRSVHIVQAIGRLRPGITAHAASAELATLMVRIQDAHPGEDPEHAVVVRDLQGSLTGEARPTLLLLLGSVGAVLLLACANLAGLTLTRTIGRQGELSLRAALGASRWRLIRQLMVESLSLGILSGGLGLLLAALLLDPLLAFLPADVPKPARLTLDVGIAAYTLLIGAGSGVLIGILVAVRAGRVDPALHLRNEGTALTASVDRLRLQRGLLAIQLVFSMVLLACSSLLLRSFREVLRVEPGYVRDRVLTAKVSLPATQYTTEQVTTWYRNLPARLEQLPGVDAASAVVSLPLSGGDSRGDLTIEGHPFEPGQAPAVPFRQVLPNYFRTMGIPLIKGREFAGQDSVAASPVVIVSRAMAERFWPGQDPIGRRIKVGPADREPWATVVGVVGDVRHEDLETEVPLETYWPHAQSPRRTMGIVVRTSVDPATLVRQVRAILREGDDGIPVWEVGTLSGRLRTSLARRRFTTGLLVGFGGAAVFLAAIGIYGVSAYGVGRRRREFAVRMALGARPERVRYQVRAESLRLAGLGVALGVGAAFLATRLMQGLLFEVSPGDPLAFVAAAALLTVAVVLASWLPARRATQADPVEALRG